MKALLEPLDGYKTYIGLGLLALYHTGVASGWWAYAEIAEQVLTILTFGAFAHKVDKAAVNGGGK